MSCTSRAFKKWYRNIKAMAWAEHRAGKNTLSFRPIWEFPGIHVQGLERLKSHLFGPECYDHPKWYKFIRKHGLTCGVVFPNSATCFKLESS